jgi:hypothetical protein
MQIVRRYAADERVKCAFSTVACAGFLAATFAACDGPGAWAVQYLAPYAFFSWWLFTAGNPSTSHVLLLFSSDSSDTSEATQAFRRLFSMSRLFHAHAVWCTPTSLARRVSTRRSLRVDSSRECEER